MHGHLPGSAVVTITADDLLPFDDDRRRVCLRAHPLTLSHPLPG